MIKQIKFFSGSTHSEIEQAVNEFTPHQSEVFDIKFTEPVNSRDNAFMDACTWITVMVIYEA